MIKAIIFSRDRALQLEILIQSIKKNLPVFDEICVLYVCSDNVDENFDGDFQRGYQRVFRELHPEVNPYYEISFRNDLLDLIYTPSVNNDNDLICFFTDDDIVYRNSGLHMKHIYNLFNTVGPITLSLRLGKNITRNNHHDESLCSRPTEMVVWHDNILLWNKYKVPEYSHFRYMFSLDGCFYSKKLLEELLLQFDFNHPNLLEGNAQKYIENYSPIMAGLEHSCVVGNPVNRVQGVFENQAGLFHGISTKELNDQFLRGKRVYFEDLANHFTNVNSVHQEIPLIMR